MEIERRPRIDKEAHRRKVGKFDNGKALIPEIKETGQRSADTRRLSWMARQG